MKRFMWMTILVLAAGLWASPMQAQDMQKKETAKAQPAESQVVLAQWNEVARKLIAMTEDFPEDKYDYKPTPAQRSFAEQLLHAAGAVPFFTAPVQGQTPAEEDPPRAKYKTKADVVAFVKKSFEDGAAVIKAKGDKGMQGTLVDPFENQKVRVYEMAYGLLEHSGEHYGQLVGYYRSAGMVPPESRPKK